MITEVTTVNPRASARQNAFMAGPAHHFGGAARYGSFVAPPRSLALQARFSFWADRRLKPAARPRGSSLQLTAGGRDRRG
jgi:hypothetical protein